MKIFFSIILFFILSIPSYANEYVLPYPSYMPGNKLYKISRIMDRLENYWYWGSIAQTRYHLQLSDKYLVEAKTLFEYKQYLLAIDALTRSNIEIMKIPGYLSLAKEEKKDVGILSARFQDALTKHSEVLETLLREVPEMFTWQPEKEASTALNLWSSIQDAISLRIKLK